MAFRRWPVAAAVVFGLAWLPLTIVLHRLARAVLPASDYETRLADGIEQTIMTAVALALLVKIGWLRTAWLTTRPALVGGLWGLLGLTVAGAIVVILAALPLVDFGNVTPAVVSAFNFTAVGVAEELWFRGLVMGGLLLAWREVRFGPLFATVLSAGLFGLIHLDPYLIVFAGLFGLGLSHLVLTTNTIWGAVAVHVLFNLLHDLPSTTASATDGWFFTVSLAFIPLAGLVALANLARDGLTAHEPRPEPVTA